MSSFRASVCVAVLFSAACGNGAASVSSATAAVSGASAPTSHPSTAPSIALTTPSVVATAVASATPPSFEPSSEPELAEWGKAREIKVGGSGKNGCETKLVREWLRVMCVNRVAEMGKPVRIEVTKGRGPNHRSKGENLKAVNDITTLVVPLGPGSDVEALFSWENETHTLRASWPSGMGEAARSISFDNEDDTTPKASESADNPVSGVTTAAPSVGGAPTPEPPIDDIAGLGDPPTDDEWQKAPEARVAGSTAAGCETKILRDWFRARCADASKKVESVTPIKGAHKTQTHVSVDGGVATLVTPFVSDTETWARFQFVDGAKTLVVRWKKGPKPETAGSFESGK